MSNFFSCGFYSVFILSQVRVGIQILTKRLASRIIPYMSRHSGSLNLLKTNAFFRTGFLTSNFFFLLVFRRYSFCKQVTQEKARLEAKNKVNQLKLQGGQGEV
jgi:hypothetical protein